MIEIPAKPIHWVPLASNGVFATVQGEGLLSGECSIFIRLANCNIACDGCDTDYRLSEYVMPESIAQQIKTMLHPGMCWIWLTGGEPAAKDPELLMALSLALRKEVGLPLAIATAGEVNLASTGVVWDFVSVSPHRHERWVQRTGNQVNLVPGLGQMTLEVVKDLDLSGFPIGARFVTPRTNRDGRPENMDECLELLRRRPDLRLGCQAHKWWGLP